jgi:phosphate transport system protein
MPPERRCHQAFNERLPEFLVLTVYSHLLFTMVTFVVASSVQGAMAQKTTRPAKIDPDRAEEKSAAKKKDGKLARLKANGTQAELMRMTLKACLIARDATFNVQDLLTNSSRMAFLAIRDCEKELDQIERQIDEQLPGAITRVNETRARQLLACLKCITDLERIGDLVMGVAQRVQTRSGQLPAGDVRHLIQMSAILHDMLEDIHRGFLSLDIDSARKVLRMDAELDNICHAMFQRYLTDNSRQKDSLGFDVMLMAQALERSGDHAKNLAEELYSLIEGHTLRHLPKRTVGSDR